MRKVVITAALSLLVAGSVTAARAADFGMTSPVPVSGWDGFYAGANIGYGMGIVDHEGTFIGDLTMSGALIGGQMGYNFTAGNGVVVGVQGDVDFSGMTGTYTGPGPLVTQTNTWEGSLTGHLGFDGGQVMPYVLAGVTAVGTTRTSSFGPISESAFLGGFTVGGGTALRISDMASVFAEARYNNYGSHTYTNLPSSPVVDMSSTEVRAGVNFHF
jgi:outer membrane immunogenic protein